jgi:hypothetical protein
MQISQLIALSALCAAAHSSGAAVKARHWAARTGLDRRAHNQLSRCIQPYRMVFWRSGFAPQPMCACYAPGSFCSLAHLSSPLLCVVFKHYGCLYDRSPWRCHDIVIHKPRFSHGISARTSVRFFTAGSDRACLRWPSFGGSTA